MPTRWSLLHHLRPGSRVRVVVLDVLVGLVCVVILGVFLVAGLRGVARSGHARHNEARCLGWCEAHERARASTLRAAASGGWTSSSGASPITLERMAAACESAVLLHDPLQPECAPWSRRAIVRT